MEIFWTLLGCAGVVFILRYGSILERPRTWLTARSSVLRELFGCSLCLGFWVGVLPMLHDWQHDLAFDPWWPFRSAAFCYVLDLVTDVLDATEGHAEK